jgi:antitoxin CptB
MTSQAPHPDANGIPVPPDMNHLRWQCRRGMLELDVILLRYLEEQFPSAPPDEQAQFRRLLQVEDPVLNEWLLLGSVPSDQTLADIVGQVRAP